MPTALEQWSNPSFAMALRLIESRGRCVRARSRLAKWWLRAQSGWRRTTKSRRLLSPPNSASDPNAAQVAGFIPSRQAGAERLSGAVEVLAQQAPDLSFATGHQL